MTVCARCGRENEPDAQLCMDCGKPMTRSPGSHAPPGRGRLAASSSRGAHAVVDRNCRHGVAITARRDGLPLPRPGRPPAASHRAPAVNRCPVSAAEYGDGVRFCPSDRQTLRAFTPDLVGQVIADCCYIVTGMGLKLDATLRSGREMMQRDGEP